MSDTAKPGDAVVWQNSLEATGRALGLAVLLLPALGFGIRLVALAAHGGPTSPAALAAKTSLIHLAAIGGLALTPLASIAALFMLSQYLGREQAHPLRSIKARRRHLLRLLLITVALLVLTVLIAVFARPTNSRELMLYVLSAGLAVLWQIYNLRAARRVLPGERLRLLHVWPGLLVVGVTLSVILGIAGAPFADRTSEFVFLESGAERHVTGIELGRDDHLIYVLDCGVDLVVALPLNTVQSIVESARSSPRVDDLARLGVQCPKRDTTRNKSVR